MTMRIRQQWHGQRADNGLRRVMRGRMRRAGGVARDLLRQKVSARSRRGSLPGQPPARQSGALMRSLKFRLRGRGLKTILQLIAGVWYARILERGSPRQEPRPFFEVTIREFVRVRYRQILVGRG